MKYKRNSKLGTFIALLILTAFRAAGAAAVENVMEGNGAILGPGDTIDIRIPAEPTFSGQYIVDEKGNFKLPLLPGLDLGTFHAEGNSVDQLEKILSDKLSEYYSMTDVSVDLVSLGVRPNRSISLLGHVSNPGNYQFYENIKLMDVLAKAGHVEETADPTRVTINRSGSEPVVVDITGILSGRDFSQNVTLQAGDYIIVPPLRPVQKIQVLVLGMVGTPGTFFVRTGARVLDAIAEAEGSMGRAAVAKTHVIRAVDGKPVVIPVDLKALLDHGDISQNVELKDGDVVFIPQTGRVDVMKVVNDIISLNLLKNIVKDEF